MANWQKVFFTAKLHRATMVKSILEENGLKPILINKKDAAYHFGQYEVYVQPEEVLRAVKIIQDEINFE